MSHQNLMRVFTVFVSGTVFVATTRADDPKPEAENSKPEQIQFKIVGEETAGGGVVFRVGESGNNNYWLGVALEAEDGHLEVGTVLPGSPAAKAGLKPEDVLVSSGDTPLKEVADLAKLLQASGGKPLALNVQREGKEITVTVTPEKREGGQTIVIGEGGEGNEGIRLQLGQRVDPQRKPAQATGRPAAGGWQVLRAPQGAGHPPIPEDLEVTIKKKGNNPIRIKVRHGAQTWTVKENELDKLPAPIRVHVAHMLPGHPGVMMMTPGGSVRPMNPAGGIQLQFNPSPANPARPSPQVTRPRPGASIGTAPAGGVAGRPLAGAPAVQLMRRDNSEELKKEVQQLKQQLHELQEQVEALQKK